MSIMEGEWGSVWRRMVEVGRSALETNGFEFASPPLVSRATVWDIQKGQNVSKIAVRTSQDRWLGFNPSGDGWKTLDDVDEVLAVTVDHVKKPEKFEVYLFTADEVRRRLNKNKAARMRKGHKGLDKYGNWIAFDRKDHVDSPTGVGSGIAELRPPIAVVPIDPEPYDPADRGGVIASGTVGNLLEEFTDRLATELGVPRDQVHLQLTIG